jgi:WD40 repeat protein
MSYFPDGQQMISGSYDRTARQWDLKTGKEIEGAWDVDSHVVAVAVSRDSRWVVIAGGDLNSAELKVFEVKTGIVKKLQGHSGRINGIDISVDNTLLASGSFDSTAQTWNLETGKLVAGPFECLDDEGVGVGVVRFSTDSKKLALKSWAGTILEVWDVQSEELDVRIGDRFDDGSSFPSTPIFWTNRNKNILAAFTFTLDDGAKTIYEFDASTLKTVGTSFKGHTDVVTGLALSFDGALVASSSEDDTIKLWAFESRQLLASFDVKNPGALILSPDSRKLVYTTCTIVSSTDPRDYPPIVWEAFGHLIRTICDDAPPDVLSTHQENLPIQLSEEVIDHLIRFCRDGPPDVLSTHQENLPIVQQEFKDQLICICDTPPDVLARAQARVRNSLKYPLFVC